MKRVVVTGLGCMSPIGNTAPDTWSAAKAAACGIGPVRDEWVAQLNRTMAGLIKGYVPEDHFERRELDIIDRFAQIALIACDEALADAGLEIDEETGYRTACILGTGLGGVETMDEGFARLYGGGPKRVHPFTVPKMMMNAAPSHISMRNNIRGPAYSIASACSSSNHAIGTALNMVRAGQCDIAITGGSECVITLGGMKAWEALRVMAPDTCRPFSKNRKGMILGEGSGIIVLEEYERAKARGATIYAEMAGFGMSSDAGDLVMPSAQHAARAMKAALADGGLNPEDIDYVNAHGTATQANDASETRSLHMTFGDHAKKLAVSSSKSMVGHSLGAAGAVEMVLTVMGVHEGVAPPTVNYTEPDPECDLDYVPNEARDMPIRAAMSNSFAFGGLNAVLTVKQAD